jgi:hypothetical protein
MFSRYGMSGMFGPPQGGGMGAGRMSQPFPSRYMPPRQMPPTGGSGYFSPPMQPRMMDTRGMLPPTDTFNAPPPTYNGMPPTGGPDTFNGPPPTMSAPPQMPTLSAPPGYPGDPNGMQPPQQFPGGMASYMNRLIGGFDPSKFR